MQDLINQSAEHFKDNPLTKYVSQNNGYGKIEITICDGEITEISPQIKHRLAREIHYPVNSNTTNG